MRTGYIGLGAMGRALARRLPAATALSVCDLSPAAVDDLVSHGAVAAASPADIGRDCDVVFLCLPRSTDVEQVLFGPAGLATTITPGSIVIDQTSGVPAETRRFATALAELGVAMLDAPVAGGVPGALAGTITIMTSGDPVAYATALPLLQAISPNAYRCSDRVGDAQALKSINNIINAAYRVATLEIAALGTAMGLSIGAMAAAFDAGAARSFMTTKLLPAIAEGRSSTDFSLALMVKDLNQAIALGAACGASTPLSDLARGMIQAALNMLGPDSRLDDMVGFMAQVTGQRLGPDAASAALSDDGKTMLLDTALAAINQLIVIENLAVAARAGLDLASIEPILASGSASSRASDAAFAAARGQAAVDAPSLSATVDILSQVAAIGARHGVAMLMTNTIRSLYIDHADGAGDGAGIARISRRLAGRDAMPMATPPHLVEKVL